MTARTRQFPRVPGVEDRYPPKLEIMNRDIVPLGTVAIHAATADPGTGLQSFNGLAGSTTMVSTRYT